jgi:predicted peptidase
MINYVLKNRDLLLSHVEYLPDNFDSQTDVKVILQFHGNGEGGVGSIESMKAELFDPNTYLKQLATFANGVVTPTGKQFPFILICPQAENNDKGQGNFWTTAVTGYNSEGVKNDNYYSKSLLQYIKNKYKGKIDEACIYTVGYSAGGKTAVTAAACGEIAGVLAACPALDSNFIIETVKDVPIKFWQNTGDGVVHFNKTFGIYKKLSREIDSSPKLVDMILNSGGHDAWTAMFADEPSLSWLLSQRLPAPILPRVFDFTAQTDSTIDLPPNTRIRIPLADGYELTLQGPQATTE